MLYRSNFIRLILIRLEILIKVKYNLYKFLFGLFGYLGLVWLLENILLVVVVVVGVVVGLVEGIFFVIGLYFVGLGGVLVGFGYIMFGLLWI